LYTLPCTNYDSIIQHIQYSGCTGTICRYLVHGTTWYYMVLEYSVQYSDHHYSTYIQYSTYITVRTVHGASPLLITETESGPRPRRWAFLRLPSGGAEQLRFGVVATKVRPAVRVSSRPAPAPFRHRGTSSFALLRAWADGRPPAAGLPAPAYCSLTPLVWPTARALVAPSSWPARGLLVRCSRCSSALSSCPGFPRKIPAREFAGILRGKPAR
jgi:hypothetical protein